MKKILTLIISILFIIPIYSKTYTKGNLKWSSNQNNYGLYNRFTKNSQHSLSIRFSPNYYYGDMEKPKDKNFILDDNNAVLNQLPYNYKPIGFSFKNQIGGSIQLQYCYLLNQLITFRANFGLEVLKGEVGFIRINEQNKYSHFQRRFINEGLTYNVGLEIYPFLNDVYCYVGIGGITSVGGKYTINQYNSQIKEENVLNGNTVPIMPVALGYRCTHNNFIFKIELLWCGAILDINKHNLDGYSGIKYPANKKTNAFNDGFFELGISFGYYIKTK